MMIKTCSLWILSAMSILRHSAIFSHQCLCRVNLSVEELVCIFYFWQVKYFCIFSCKVIQAFLVSNKLPEMYTLIFLTITYQCFTEVFKLYTIQQSIQRDYSHFVPYLFRSVYFLAF
jgi:hypothetical protein